MSGQAAIAAAKAWQDAFNNLDANGMADNTNFPHIRHAEGTFRFLDTREDFLNAHANMKERLSAQGWAHTTMEKVEVVHEGPDKVHLAILQHREHADGTVYRPFETLWIMTLQDGHWGVQFRSSFLR